MKTIKEIASFFRSELSEQGLTQARLETEAGIAHQTLINVLSGQADFKVTTLLSVADRLGYEMVFVPKVAAAGLAYQEDRPVVKSRVRVALEKIRQKGQS
jgi:transcriptional regulator with XRE-family HTH domain